MPFAAERQWGFYDRIVLMKNDTAQGFIEGITASQAAALKSTLDQLGLTYCVERMKCVDNDAPNLERDRSGRWISRI